MKVAMLGWEFPPFVSGGLGVHCFELTRALAKLGVEIDFFMPKTAMPVSTPPGMRVIQVGRAPFGPYSRPARGASEAYGWDFLQQARAYNAELARVLRARRVENYSLIHNHDWITVPAAGEAKAALRLPLVFTVHSTEYDRTPWPWQEILCIEKAGLAQADRVITVSNLMKGRLLQMGAAAEKIRVIYNGVDFAKFEKKKFVDRKEKIVLFLGRLVEQKGPQTFLHAAARVAALEPDARFVIIGDGDLLPSLISQAIALGISDRVSFMGHVPDEIRRVAYARSDVFVMPSVSEPFGIAALEAMASGTPCIVSKSSGVSEAARACLKVDFWDVEGMADKICNLLRYPLARRALGDMELAEVRGFSWERTARDALAVYKEVAK
ncbi:MAG: glycosyltransferase family 4 protein [Candidatus Micrarchaeia archaeon]